MIGGKMRPIGNARSPLKEPDLLLETTSLEQKRIAGLDSIRAICAFWVVMGHFGGPPLTEGLDKSNSIARVFGGIYNNLWNGPAAVIIFFVISGFCIHYPHASSLRIPSIGGYAVRRYLRIGIPLAVAIGLSALLSVNLSLFNDSILWSLVAELIYYTIYPGLLLARRHFTSWLPLVVVGFAMALALSATNPSAKSYPSFGNTLNWILGLPCWIGGCWLADRVVDKKLPSSVSCKSIWMWRGLILGVALVCSILRFHTPIGYPWSLNAFGMLVVFWLANEIVWSAKSPPQWWLEWAGGWSYSLYLFHVMAMSIYSPWSKPNFGFFFNWLFMMIFILSTSYIFYLLIEYPVHRVSRYAGRRIGRGDPMPANQSLHTARL